MKKSLLSTAALLLLSLAACGGETAAFQYCQSTDAGDVGPPQSLVFQVDDGEYVVEVCVLGVSSPEPQDGVYEGSMGFFRLRKRETGTIVTQRRFSPLKAMEPPDWDGETATFINNGETLELKVP